MAIESPAAVPVCEVKVMKPAKLGMYVLCGFLGWSLASTRPTLAQTAERAGSLEVRSAEPAQVTIWNRPVDQRLALSVPAFAAVNLALVGLWFGVVVFLNRQLRAKAAEAGQPHL